MITRLRDGAHHQAGSFDRAKRWYPYDEYFDIPGAFLVRGPSRAYPYGFLKHFYTHKFARLLAATRPLLYCQLQGITDKEQCREVVAFAIKARLKG